MPAAVWKNRRRLTPWCFASRLPSSLMRASTSFCFTVCGAGVNSSLETNCVGIGDAKDDVSAGSRSMESLLSRGSLHGREGRGTQDHVSHLLHDRAVLLAFGERARTLGVLGERVELGDALVQALPCQQIDQLVAVAAEHVVPVADLPEAVLLERGAREVAEPIGDVLDLAGHRLVLAQLEEEGAPARRLGPVGLAAVHLRIRGRLHELVVDAVDQRSVLLGLGPLLGPLGVGAPGGVLLGPLLLALPAPDVDELVALLGDDRRPEADQAKPVLLPLVDREAPEAVDERGKLTGGDVVAAKLVEHAAPRLIGTPRPAGPQPRDGLQRALHVEIRTAPRIPPSNPARRRASRAGGLPPSRPAAPAFRTAERRRHRSRRPRRSGHRSRPGGATSP